MIINSFRKIIVTCRACVYVCKTPSTTYFADVNSLSLTLRSSTYSRFVATTHRMSHVSSNSSDFSFFHNIHTRQRRGFLRCCLLLAAAARSRPPHRRALFTVSFTFGYTERATGRRTTYAARLVDVFVLYGVRLFKSSGFFFFASLHHNSRSIDERLSDICFLLGLCKATKKYRNKIENEISFSPDIFSVFFFRISFFSVPMLKKRLQFLLAQLYFRSANDKTCIRRSALEIF